MRRKTETDQTIKNAGTIDHSTIGSSNLPNFNFLPHYLSASKTMSGGQKLVFSLFLLCYLSLIIVAPQQSLYATMVCFGFIYLIAGFFRLGILAAWHGSRKPFELPNALIPTNQKYTVLVALYDEANQVEALCSALSNLVWGKSNLEIFLVCEEKDLETISAIKKLYLPSFIKLLICPQGKPQTKPRALNFALQFATGDYLVIFDAEDRPHPHQLIEAFNVFSLSGDKIVCLQAPLVIDNGSRSFWTKLFSIEYTTLFYGIVPTLTKWNAPLPLGGTSNHFKLKTLKDVGGWDIFNVTEDADLGIRLARMGYLCGTLTLPTYEEAPINFKNWFPQRTRWIKGWMQTFFVHTRNPAKLHTDLGLKNHLFFHLILTCIVISVLVHPFFLIATTVHLINFFNGTSNSTFGGTMTGMSVFILVLGYATYGLLALSVVGKSKIKSLKWYITLLPIYWLYISLAGWRALFQLFYNPHIWEKTAHGVEGTDARNTPNFNSY